MTVNVAAGSARITTGTAPSDYGYWAFIDTAAGESVTIATASSSPRIDYIVMYVDKSVAGSTSPASVNNTNNVVKLASVAGTPGASPQVPTSSQISTAIGAANPYVLLAQVAIANGTTQITATNITDRRNLASIKNPIMFAANMSSSVTYTGAGVKPYVFPNVEYDTAGAYNPSTGLFTAPVPGIYRFSGNGSWTSAPSTQDYFPVLQKNGTDSRRGPRQISAASSTYYAGLSAPIKLAVGDTVNFAMFYANTASTEGNAASNYFTGEVVSLG